jgi:hypothetical protein
LHYIGKEWVKGYLQQISIGVGDGKASLSNMNLATLTENVHKLWAGTKLEVTQQSFNREAINTELQPNNINSENGLVFKQVMEISHLLPEGMEKTSP